ncbi:MAG: AbrB/MazE/SpoVT family DNA-binding domain-containing protein [Proteobacteria bacterium]|nr:MAG: AbrB/MazE/SpoVT family DNA-binding domain-containing protein [Pseudomonadota bacterium]
MQTYNTKIFKSGNSLAVRIPKDIDVSNYKEVIIYQDNNKIVISPKIDQSKWDLLFDKLENIKSDDMEVSKLPPQKRAKYFD